MREMIDSGVEWIGEIPREWSTLRMKSIIGNRNGGVWGNEPTQDTIALICIRVADFDFEKMTIKHQGNSNFTKRGYTDAEIQRSLLKNGDILIEKSGGGEKTPVGRAIIFNEDFQCTCANFIERLSVSEEIESRFFLFVLFSFYKNGFIQNYIKQTTGIQNLDISSMLSSESIAIPCKQEQNKIVEFLTAKCAQIDVIIARQQEIIEKLKAYRLSVITEAVTKGLIPDVAMKDSDVPSIGKIPETWNVIKMARIIIQTQNGLTRRDTEESKGQIVLKLKNITEQSTISYDELNRIELTEKEKMQYGLAFGDFLFVRVNGSQALVGKCAVFDRCDELVAYNDHIIRVQLLKQCNREYVRWFLLSSSGKKEIQIHINTAAGQFTISGNGLRNLFITYPPLWQQEKIVNFLVQKSSHIDMIVNKKQSLITKLTEYKKSLIYEVVTGKKEV